jgi:hypothetical protein
MGFERDGIPGAPVQEFRKLIGSAAIGQAAVTDFAAALQYGAAESIDELLRTRPQFRDIGTCAIAHTILAAENVAALTADKDKRWYPYLFRCMTDADAGADAIASNNLTILTYNYDRSLEQYFRFALEHTFGCKENKIDHLMTCLQIHHLHGVLGSLREIPYGAGTTYEALRLARNKIKLIFDVPGYDLDRPLNPVRQAKRIIILGFGFHPTNLDLLSLKESTGEIYASGFGLSEEEQAAISNRVGRDINWGLSGETIRQFLRKSRCLHYGNGAGT